MADGAGSRGRLHEPASEDSVLAYPPAAGWNNTTLVKHDAANEVAKLKQQGNGDMFVFGSANLSKTLMDEKLFDEYRIGIAPVIHGRGRHLFSDGSRPDGLQLLEARPLSTGCLILRYKSKG